MLTPLLASLVNSLCSVVRTPGVHGPEISKDVGKGAMWLPSDSPGLFAALAALSKRTFSLTEERLPLLHTSHSAHATDVEPGENDTMISADVPRSS